MMKMGLLRTEDQTAGALAAVSPVFQPHRTASIESPYHVSENLLKAMPAELRERSAAAILRARAFAPLDHGAYAASPSEHGIHVAVAHEGAMRVSASLLRRGMSMTVFEPALDSYTFGLRTQGTLAVGGPGRIESASYGTGLGVMYRERPGTRVTASAGHAGISFELPYPRMIALLEGLTERPAHAELQFAPCFSLAREPGASISRAVRYIEQELAIRQSLLSAGQSGTTMQDLLIRALLAAVPHSYAALLEREPKLATPFNVGRAEAFMHAHLHESIDIADIAAAAGCGIRSLQVSFQKYRGCAPMAALRSLRLGKAREMLRQTDGMTPTQAAAICGFTNPGRFAAYYLKMFGERPSETVKAARRRR